MWRFLLPQALEAPHSPIHTLVVRAATQGANLCTSRAIWGSVSCSRTPLMGSGEAGLEPATLYHLRHRRPQLCVNVFLWWSRFWLMGVVWIACTFVGVDICVPVCFVCYLCISYRFQILKTLNAILGLYFSTSVFPLPRGASCCCLL